MNFLKALPYLLTIGLIFFTGQASAEAVNGYMSVDTFGMLVVAFIAIATAIIVFVVRRIKSRSRQDKGDNLK